jgi:hypothetical protein
MGKGLLAWWRRRIVARGLAGAVLFAVPVAVAALIGFGASLSGVAGGLSAVANGPDAIPAAQTTTPNQLNNAVTGLASKAAPGSAGVNTVSTNDLGGGTSGTGTVSGTGSNQGGGSGGGGGQTISAPSAPNVNIPGGDGGSGAGSAVNGAVNNVNGVIGGVGNTVNGLIGR